MGWERPSGTTRPGAISARLGQKHCIIFSFGFSGFNAASASIGPSEFVQETSESPYRQGKMTNPDGQFSFIINGVMSKKHRRKLSKP